MNSKQEANRFDTHQRLYSFCSHSKREEGKNQVEKVRFNFRDERRKSSQDLLYIKNPSFSARKTSLTCSRSILFSYFSHLIIQLFHHPKTCLLPPSLIPVLLSLLSSFRPPFYPPPHSFPICVSHSPSKTP